MDETMGTNLISESIFDFADNTLSNVGSGKVHVVASAFAFGREELVPLMIQQLLLKWNISEEIAPSFHYYLKRHIDLDTDEHGPIALEMVESLCEDDPQKWQQAQEAAESTVNTRINFWSAIKRDLGILN